MDASIDMVTGDDRMGYGQSGSFEPLATIFEVPPEDEIGWSSSNQNIDPYGSRPVQCHLFHKVRGGKGEWKEILHNDMIRVTKGVGKKVKLVVKSTISFKVNELQLALQDMAEGTRPSRVQQSNKEKSPKFAVENTNTKQDGNRVVAELFIKLYKLSKQLAFNANIVKDGVTYSGYSVVFGTHNSGKQSRKKDKLDEKDGMYFDFGVVLEFSPKKYPFLVVSINKLSELGPRKRLGDDDQMFDRNRIGYDCMSALLNYLCFFIPNPDNTTHFAPKNLVSKAAPAMKSFGSKVIAEEARKRNSSVIVYVACKKLNKRPPEDFTIFIYKNENLLREEAVSIGTTMGRAIFLRSDSDDCSGSYTLVAAIRKTDNSMETPPPGEGVAALFDFRRDNDSMKLIPIQPFLLSVEPTNVWLIGSFHIDLNDATWVNVQTPTVSQIQPTIPMHHMMSPPVYQSHIPSGQKVMNNVPEMFYMGNTRQVYSPPQINSYAYNGKSFMPVNSQYSHSPVYSKPIPQNIESQGYMPYYAGYSPFYSQPEFRNRNM